MQIVFCVSYILLNIGNAIALSEHESDLALTLFLRFVSIATSYEDLVLHRCVVARITAWKWGFPTLR